MRVLLFLALVIGCGLISKVEAKPSRAHTGIVLDNEEVRVWNTYYRTGVKVCRLEKATGNYDCSFSRYEGNIVWCDINMQPKGCQFDPYGPQRR